MPLDVTGWKESAPRVFAGVSLGRSSGRLKVALLFCRGEGWHLRCTAAHALSCPVPEGTMLPDAIRVALETLCARAEIRLANVDVIGLRDVPEASESRVAAIIAGQTGVTVVSGFQNQDIAAGGAGGPFSPIPDWFLHRSLRTGRLIVDLGPTLRVTFLHRGARPEEAVCFDVGPCNGFLDRLVRELSRDKYQFDPSGHFAVQGTSCESLIGKWISHPFLLKSPPRFLAPEDIADGFFHDSLAFARELKLSAADVLCSANHFVLRNLREAIHRFLDPDGIDEAWVCGGGGWNGLLWKLIREMFPGKPTARTDDAGMPTDARRAIHAALLAYCAIEHLPANLPAITGASRRRVLGQITPGAEENWDRCVINLADRFEAIEQAA